MSRTLNRVAVPGLAALALLLLCLPADACHRRRAHAVYYTAPVYACAPVYYGPPMLYEAPRPGAVANAAAYDNYFEPPTLTVPVGATVRWTNRGQHTHTATSDKQDWDSGDLKPGQSYSYTFSKPGTYAYYCRHHSKEMRGTVIVR